jgi:hypothetical protein
MKNMHHRSSGYGALPPTQGRDQVGFLLSALQESRRQQAVRIISRYRHLVHEPPGIERPKMIQKRKTEADESRNLASQSSVGGRQPIVGLMIALAILGFGILHLIGASVLQRDLDHRGTESASLSIRGD